MMGVSMSQQYPLQTINAAAVEETLQGAVVVALATAIDQPVVAIGAVCAAPPVPSSSTVIVIGVWDSVKRGR